MSSALLLGRTTYEDAPGRRASFGLIIGTLLGALTGVGFWVFGLIKPEPGTDWATRGAVVVEAETGNRLLWEDGRLVPVMNYASALLRAGTDAHIETVERARLGGVERTEPVGIPGAPDSLPTPENLVAGPWLLCLPGSGSAAGEATGVLGMRIADELVAEPLGFDGYLWVRDVEGTSWVLTADQRLRLDDPVAAAAIGLMSGSPPTAPDAFLEALPEGPSIAPVPGPAPSGTALVGESTQPVGRFFVTRSSEGATEYFVLRDDGLAPVTATEVALAEASGSTPPAPISVAVLAATARSADESLMSRLPDLVRMSAVQPGDQEFCLVQDSRGAEVISSLATAPAGSSGTGMLPGEATPGDQVNVLVGASVDPMSGLLVASVPVPADPSTDPDRYLVTDTGLKYPVIDDAALSALGLGGVVPRPVDAVVLAQIPTGPALDRAAVLDEKGLG